MKRETIRWELPEQFRQLGVVPITLISETGAVAASGISGQDLEVPEGTYFLCVKLSTGRTVIGADPVVIGDGLPVVPSLTRELARHVDIADFSTGSVPAAGIQAAANLALGAGRDSDSTVVSTVYHLRGDLVAVIGQGRGVARPMQWGLPHALHAGRHDLVRNSQADQALIFTNDGGARMVVLPFDRSLKDGEPLVESIVLELQADASRPRFLSSVSTATNAFVEYVDRGLFSESASLSAAYLGQLETRDTSSTSLLGMLASAYVLLRANDLDHLEQSLAVLSEFANQTPDYWAILAELHARRGRHDQAVAALVESIDNRCPWFRSGLSYQLQRMRAYLDADADEQAFALPSRARRYFAQHVETLQVMASKLDSSELITTFLLDASELEEIAPARWQPGMEEEIRAGLESLSSPEEEIWFSLSEESFA